MLLHQHIFLCFPCCYISDLLETCQPLTGATQWSFESLYCLELAFSLSPYNFNVSYCINFDSHGGLVMLTVSALAFTVEF